MTIRMLPYFEQLVHLEHRATTLGYVKANATWAFEGLNGFLKGFVTGNREMHIGIESRLRAAINSACLFSECLQNCPESLSNTVNKLLRRSPVYEHLLLDLDSTFSDKLHSHSNPKSTWVPAPGVQGAHLSLRKDDMLQEIPPGLCHLLNIDLSLIDPTTLSISTYTRYIDSNGSQYTTANYGGSASNLSPYFVLKDDQHGYVDGIYFCRQFFCVPNHGTFVEAVQLQPCPGTLQDKMLEEVHQFVNTLNYDEFSDVEDDDINLSQEQIQKFLRDQFRSYQPLDSLSEDFIIQYFPVQYVKERVWCVTEKDVAGQTYALHMARPYEFDP